MAAHLHLRTTRAALSRLLAVDGHNSMLARLLGLDAEAGRALRWWRQPLAPHAVAGEANFTLGFDERCAGARLPRALRSALDGSMLPVRSVRAGPTLEAQRHMATINQRHTALPGALAGVLRDTADPSRLYALTAGHVWGAGVGSAQFDRVQIDASDGSLPTLFGHLLDWRPRFTDPQPTHSIDAAIAEIDGAALNELSGCADFMPMGSNQVVSGQRLRLLSRSGPIEGGEPALGDFPLSLDAFRTYRITRALLWRPDRATTEGDSGAPIWNGNDELVALHAGGLDQHEGRPLAIAVPIELVLRWAGAEVVHRGQAPRPATLPLRAITELPRISTAADPAAVPAADAGTDLDILARTLWGEARSEGMIGMEAVAHVVHNRVAARSWWGRDIVGVCHKAWQFSCWNANDPNRAKLLQLTTATVSFSVALAAARSVMKLESEGRRAASDPTNGATHYYAPRVVSTPNWAQGKRPCASIGGHEFFKGIA